MISSILKTIPLIILLALSTAFAQEDPPVISIDALVREALAGNPGLKSARYQTMAVQSKIPQVGAWEPPQIGVEFAKSPTGSFPNPLDKQMEYDYFIQQKIPFPGKIPAMERSMESSAAMTGYTEKALQNETVLDVKNAVYDLYLTEKKISINRDTRSLVRDFSDIAKRQYEVGRGTQADVIRVQTELSMLTNDGMNLEQEKRIDIARINRILGRPSGSDPGSAPDIEADIPPAPEKNHMAEALDNRPELIAMSKSIDMKNEELTVAKKEYYPDIMLRLMYKNMEDGEDYWSTMVSVDVPFLFLSGGKFRGKAEESRLGVMKAKSDYKAMEDMTRYQVREAESRLQTGRNTLDLYKFTVIPQADQTVQSARAAYLTGKAEIFSLIDASRTLLKARLDYYTAVADYMKNLAALDQAVGTNPYTKP